MPNDNDKSLESWIWGAACSIRGAKDAPKYKEFILPLIFAKRLCDVYDDELNRITQEVGSRAKAFKLVKHDKKLVRIIHDMEGEIQIGDTFRNPKFRKGNRLQTFDRVVANPMWNQTEFKEKDYDADELDRFPKGAGFPGSKADWGWMQHILASVKPGGRAAVVLDTGAASRGSGNANTNKEKDVRRWFVEQDLVEGVLSLPENLFYNTTAPGIVIVINKEKPRERQGKLFLLNASCEFVKGDPKNYIPEEAVVRIADTFKAWREEEKYSRIVMRDEIAKNDFNISPSRYIHTGAGEEYRSIAEIVEELNALEEEAKATDAALKAILKRIGV